MSCEVCKARDKRLHHTEVQDLFTLSSPLERMCKGALALGELHAGEGSPQWHRNHSAMQGTQLLCSCHAAACTCLLPALHILQSYNMEYRGIWSTQAHYTNKKSYDPCQIHGCFVKAEPRWSLPAVCRAILRPPGRHVARHGPNSGRRRGSSLPNNSPRNKPCSNAGLCDASWRG